MSQTNTNKKLILVIGATGTQGLYVIDALLAPARDGSPSPYAVRALTRDPKSRRAKLLEAKGVECVEGTYEDYPSVIKALEGVYGVWANTDGFTVGETKEVYAGLRLYEAAKQVGTVQHFVWSNLDYSFKKGNWNPKYHCDHYDGKGRVLEFLKAQPSDPNGFTWSSVTTGPYMEMLKMFMFGPLNKRADGTYVFASPIGDGYVPMIALSDLGYFARYTFDHRTQTSGRDLEVASDLVNWNYLVSTFQKVTGQKAVYLSQSFDNWFNNFNGADMPEASDLHGQEVGPLTTTWRSNFTAWWNLFRDDICKRDMEWIKGVHPGVRSLETWMRENKYTGEELQKDFLKNMEDGRAVTLRTEVISRL